MRKFSDRFDANNVIEHRVCLHLSDMNMVSLISVYEWNEVLYAGRNHRYGPGIPLKIVREILLSTTRFEELANIS